MKNVRSLSGWIVSAAIVCAWLATCEKEGECDARESRKPSPECEEPAECGGRTVRAKPQDPQGKAVGDADAKASAGSTPGDDWRPPRGTLAVLYAQLKDASPQERALAKRIYDACKEWDGTALLDACKEACACPHPCVRAMAVDALSSACGLRFLEAVHYPAQDRRAATEALFLFHGDECKAVRDNAARAAAAGVTMIGERDPAGFDLAMSVLDLFGASAVDSLFSQEQLKGAMRDSFFAKSRDGNPGDYEKALRAFAELSASENADKARLGRNGLQELLEEGPPSFISGRYRKLDLDELVKEHEFRLGLTGNEAAEANPYEGMSDDEAIMTAVAKAKAIYDDAKARFPDDKDAANAYMFKARKLSSEAQRRYGDTPKASEWLAEELDWLQANLEMRRNAGDAKKTP